MLMSWHKWKQAAALAALILVPGCDWFEDQRPERAVVLLDGAPGGVVQVIASTDFLAGVAAGGRTEVVVFSSDTVMATLPFDTTYSIDDEFRFFVQASRANEDLATLHMQVYVDSDKEFDESGPLIEDAPYRFVYAFNQRLTRDIDVVF